MAPPKCSSTPSAPARAEGRLPAPCVALIAASAESLFATVHRQLTAIFAAGSAGGAAPGALPSARGCKYGLNVLLQGLAVPEVARSLSQAVLRDVVSLLLMRLLDDRSLLRFEEGPTLIKAVNVLMLKVLEASNRTYCFAALLQLLRGPPPAVPAAQLPKFYDLVVKCLIKLTKSLQSDTEASRCLLRGQGRSFARGRKAGGMLWGGGEIPVGRKGRRARGRSCRSTIPPPPFRRPTRSQSVDLEGLLLNIHDFFLYLGVDEIRRRSSADDKPLRMVKTILHELCKAHGYGIYTATTRIPGRHSQPAPIIFAYISLNLQTLAASGAHWGGGVGIPPPPPGLVLPGLVFPGWALPGWAVEATGEAFAGGAWVAMA